MKKSTLFTLWGVMFILCACLGFIPEPEHGLSVFLTFLGIVFFLPPGLLVWKSIREKDSLTLTLLRNLSALSLGLTLALLLGNFLSILGSQTLGDFLHIVLGIVSSPMFCCQYWLVSLFGWACLLMVCISSKKK